MPFLKSDKLTSIKACLASPVALFCEYLKNLKGSNKDPFVKVFSD